MADEEQDEQEQTTEPDAGAPEPPPEPTSEPGAGDLLPEGEPPQEPPEDAIPVGSGQGESEKEIEEVSKKLAKEATRHANRVSEIMGEAAQELLVCELCWPPAPGFRFEQMPEEQRSAVLTAIGLPPPPDLEDDPESSQCPTCKGHGKVKTGSHVSGFDAMVCTRCKGHGAIGARFDAAPTRSDFDAAITPSNDQQPPAAPDGEAEAMMAALRSKGFTVMAPPAPVGA